METESFTSQGVVDDTRRGLLDSPKWLSSLYFYDERGSKLFEAICETAEYYPTRTESQILEDHIEGILDAVGPDITLAELGSGSSTKTRAVLKALLSRQGIAEYLPCDVSADFLAATAQRLSEDFPGLEVEPIAAEYGKALAIIGQHTASRRLVLFLGSSIGNFEPDEQEALLRTARGSLKPGDAFLLGTDLVKDPNVLEAAYNDASGVTAQFNQNILANLAHQLGGDIDVEAFAHRAFWNARESRIEMHLEAIEETRLRFPKADLDVDVAAGERIHTENSYKFTMERVHQLAASAGFTLERTWTDANDWFGLHLLRA